MPNFTDHPTHVQTLIQAAIASVNPHTLVQNHLSQNQLPAHDRLYIVSVGKAAIPMARAAAQTVEVTEGIAIAKAESADLPSHIAYHQGSHPIPSEKSITATQAVKKFLEKPTANDLVLVLLSGGTSALLTQPIIPLPAWFDLGKALLECGATINQINTVRQRFDAVKGGGMLEWTHPAPVHTLILSDVIGDNLSHIGSGPTVMTAQNNDAVRAILTQFRIFERVQASTADAMQAVLVENRRERFLVSTSTMRIIGNVHIAADAVATVAQALGFETEIVTAEQVGEAREVGAMMAHKLRQMPPQSCAIYGGETTVTIEGEAGVGGRNQELALAGAIALDGVENAVLVSLATDGEDGPTDSAGAYVTGSTVAEMSEQAVSPQNALERHDAYHALKTHLKIGPTGTNVNDLQILLRY